MGKQMLFPEEVGDGRVDTLIKAFSVLTESSGSETVIDWSHTTTVTPAGLGIAACLFDTIVEQKCAVKSIGIDRKLRGYTPIENLLSVKKHKALPKPQIHNFEDRQTILRGVESSIDLSFPDLVENHFKNKVDEEPLDAARLIINELMVNCVDHSGAERYYLYAGLRDPFLHVGVLDMGISIPAKLSQKYRFESDELYLLSALKKGISTRRTRTGGMGLYYMTELLKENEGRLTIISRDSSVRRYFRRRRTVSTKLKHRLAGTWCFARIRLNNK